MSFGKSKEEKDKDKTTKKTSTTTIIKLSDTSKIPKNVKVIKFERPLLDVDSSRFVKRNINSTKNITVTKMERASSFKNLTIDPAIYGSHTNNIAEYISNYNKNHGDRLYRIGKSHKSHLAFIDNVLKKNRLPKEIKSLAIIESALNFNAVSPVGASGPWQFMPETGRMCGLRVDATVDERNDLYKSTIAASKYLKTLYNMFDDWLLVIAAYNWGPGAISRVLNSSNGNSFWDIKSKLPKETQNHVMAFIAVSTIMDSKSNCLELGRYPSSTKIPKANFSSLSSNFGNKEIAANENEVNSNSTSKLQVTEAEKLQISALKVKGNYHLSAIAEVLEEDVSKLERWNPDFNEKIKNSQDAVLIRIPSDKLDRFLMKKEMINRLSVTLLQAK